MKKLSVPKFAVGQKVGVRTYVEEALDRLQLRVPEATDAFRKLVLGSLDACADIMEASLTMGMVEQVQIARELWNMTGDIFVSKDSELVGENNLKQALRFMADGGNVIVVQNHRSGADTVCFEAMVNRTLRTGDVCKNWAYMSGHAVNLFLIPLVFTAALRRFQIFSAKYLSMGGTGMDNATMGQQNMRALLALRQHMGSGGKLLCYYPEGGRGDDGMKKGEPKTSCIPRIVGKASKRGLLILPTYVHGAVNILAPNRGPNEYNEFLEIIQRGQVSIRIGRPVYWNEISQSCSNQAAGDDNHWNELVNDTVLGLVSELGGDDEIGYYAQRKEDFAVLN